MENKELEELKNRAKEEVPVSSVLSHFDWKANAYGNIRCPNPEHDDKNPSCKVNKTKNTVRCFACGETWDVINLYRHLSAKVNSEEISFIQAVKRLLELEDYSSNFNNCTPIKMKWTSKNVSKGQGNNDLFEKVLSNCKSLNGYTLNYLHERGIFLYPTYVYKNQAYTQSGIDQKLNDKNTSDKEKIRLTEIRDKGKLYNGIGEILKKNKISILSNYYEHTNNIIYLFDYPFLIDEDLFGKGSSDYWNQDYEYGYLSYASNHLMVQKSLCNRHLKKSIGESNFAFLTLGMDSSDIYVCEGVEDALSMVSNGYSAVSLNSLSNLRSFQSFLEDYFEPRNLYRFVLCFDHDESGQKATQDMIEFFEEFNEDMERSKPFEYAVCVFPEEYHDINDYWRAKVYK